MYRNIPEEEAIATVDAAWDNGVRYFDTGSTLWIWLSGDSPW